MVYQERAHTAEATLERVRALIPGDQQSRLVERIRAALGLAPAITQDTPISRAEHDEQYCGLLDARARVAELKALVATRDQQLESLVLIAMGRAKASTLAEAEARATTPAERAVLDAFARLSDEEVERIYRSGNVEQDLASAEMARREAKP